VFMTSETQKKCATKLINQNITRYFKDLNKERIFQWRIMRILKF